MKEQKRVSKGASKTVQVRMRGSVETDLSDDKNVSLLQRSFSKQQQWRDRQSQ